MNKDWAAIIMVVVFALIATVLIVVWIVTMWPNLRSSGYEPGLLNW